LFQMNFFILIPVLVLVLDLLLPITKTRRRPGTV